MEEKEGEGRSEKGGSEVAFLSLIFSSFLLRCLVVVCSKATRERGERRRETGGEKEESGGEKKPIAAPGIE